MNHLITGMHIQVIFSVMRRTTVLDYTLQGSGYLFFDASLQSSQKHAPRFPTLISKLGKYQAKSSGPGKKKTQQLPGP